MDAKLRYVFVVTFLAICSNALWDKKLPQALQPQILAEIVWHSESGGVTWGLQCDFPGPVIASSQTPGEQCGQKCLDNSQCTHFRFSPATGTCYLRHFDSNQIASSVSDGSCGWVAHSASGGGGGNGGGNGGEIVWHSEQGGVTWGLQCDFSGPAIASFQTPGEQCGQKCVDNSQCTHFRFNPSTGTCYLRHFDSNQIASSVSDGSCGWVNRGSNSRGGCAGESNCASTTTYWDGHMGACGCGTGDTPYWWQFLLHTAAGNPYIFGQKTWCGGGCGLCWKLTPTGYSPTGGRGCVNCDPIVVMITNLCPVQGNEEWCSSPNKHGYKAHFDLMDFNMNGPIKALGWNNPEVRFEFTSCGQLGSPNRSYYSQCQCSSNGPTSAPNSPSPAPNPAPTPAPTPATPHDWMRVLPNEKLLTELFIPGTHDSATYNYDGSATSWVKAQWVDITTQLNEGIRFLDIRTRKVDDDDGLDFPIHHGAYYAHLNLHDVFTQVTNFLNAQPTETVLMRVKQEYSERDIFEEDFKRFIQKWNYASYLFTEKKIPKVGDVRKKIVIIGQSGDRDWNYGLKWLDQIMQDDAATNIESKKRNIYDEFIKMTKPSDKLHFNFISMHNEPDGIANFARVLNPYTESLLKINTASFYGIVPMDFYTLSLVNAIWRRSLALHDDHVIMPPTLPPRPPPPPTPK